MWDMWQEKERNITNMDILFIICREHFYPSVHLLLMKLYHTSEQMEHIISILSGINSPLYLTDSFFNLSLCTLKYLYTGRQQIRYL